MSSQQSSKRGSNESEKCPKATNSINSAKAIHARNSEQIIISNKASQSSQKISNEDETIASPSLQQRTSKNLTTVPNLKCTDKDDFHPRHILESDVIAASQNRRPSLQRDMQYAKSILQDCSGDSGDCLYDHMADILKRVLDERPPNVIDYFENFSEEVKLQRYRDKDNFYLQPTYVEPNRLESAKRLLKLCGNLNPQLASSGSLENFQIDGIIENEFGQNDDVESCSKKVATQNIVQLQFYWSLVGIGLPQQQTFLLACSMDTFAKNPIIKKMRFWGQIYGIENNYYILEVDLTEKELHLRNKSDQSESNCNIEADRLNIVSDKLIPKPPLSVEEMSALPPIPPLPRANFKTKPVAPTEKQGTGINRKIYFVTNRLEDEWIELPPITPQQILQSRKIKKYFTGFLDAAVNSYPIFCGLEKHLLHAVIARITASTYVAPVGFYKIGSGDEDEEEVEEEEEEDDYINVDKETTVDPAYLPLSKMELLKIENWSHYRPNILKQGRITHFNADAPKEDESSGDEEEEFDDYKEIIEQYLPLLRNCSEDLTNENVQPWTIKSTPSIFRDDRNATTLIRSNLWPGAVSYTNDRFHDSTYFGWGTKYVSRNLPAPEIPSIQEEYTIDEEIMETMDPVEVAEEVVDEIIKELSERMEMSAEQQHENVIVERAAEEEMRTEEESELEFWDHGYIL